MAYWRYRLLKPPISLNTLLYTRLPVESQKQDKFTGPIFRIAQSILLFMQQTLNSKPTSKISLRSIKPTDLARPPRRRKSRLHKEITSPAITPKKPSSQPSMSNSYNTESIQQEHKELFIKTNHQPQQSICTTNIEFSY
ncbi:MAG: hypothetical protein B6D70_10950 [gamma proteobacterium symbiont of Stewartia floridana]|nr:MAG: hypothetical protein B6D76_14180 [gamma proteobacterium symbiont of Stewartia floridana]RLW56948.1 MAG: hypothetical protein B6D75_19235 [gamma proteobacterium symbiont of Stewartia floridana]RLW60120.1 MAG: hypothetical protein B6D70_10950 [gamma proteobacterium symbiont of Stewartia floridana]RLW64142.1 MAG: hypothetical protein B6D73_11330 [gamma proteobacterium symbiont of Stewartia floridana]